MIKNQRPDIPIITEIRDLKYFSFLFEDQKENEIMEKWGYQFCPTFTNGQVFISNMMDSLAIQSHFNIAILDVMSSLLQGTFCDGSGSDSPRWIRNRSQLMCIKVPKKFIDADFKSLFSYLIKEKNLLAIALYRTGSVASYPITKPNHDTQVLFNDLVYVLGDSMVQYEGGLIRHQVLELPSRVDTAQSRRNQGEAESSQEPVLGCQ